MNSIDKVNLESIKNIILYVMKVSPVKTYEFINKLIYCSFERQLIESGTFMFNDVFIIKNKLPYLRILDIILNKSIDGFNNPIKLTSGNLESSEEPDLDYISEYSKGVIDELVHNSRYMIYLKELTELVNSEDTDSYDPIKIIDQYCKDVKDHVSFYMEVERDQFYPDWIK